MKKIDYEAELAGSSDIDVETELVYDVKGRRIDNHYVTQAVADLNAYMRAGRPSLHGKSGKSPQVTFRIPPSLRQAAEMRAIEEGKTLSELAREAFERYLLAT